MSIVIASDSKPLIRGKMGQFKAHISCAVIFRNPENFMEKYIKFMENLFSDFEKERERKIYKSFDLGSILAENQQQFYDIILR